MEAEPAQWIISIKTRKFCERFGVDAVVALVFGGKTVGKSRRG